MWPDKDEASGAYGQVPMLGTGEETYILIVCVSMIRNVLYIVTVQGRRVRWFTARGWLRRVRLNAVSGSVTS